MVLVSILDESECAAEEMQCNLEKIVIMYTRHCAIKFVTSLKLSCFKFLGFWTCDLTEYTIKRVIDWDIHPN